MDIIGLATPEVADEIARLREENARLQRRAEEASIDFAEASRERDEARAEAKLWRERSTSSARDSAALEAEVSRLEGLILDWDDCWRRDPFQDPGAAGRGDEGLMAEVRRIRAQREEGSDEHGSV